MQATEEILFSSPKLVSESTGVWHNLKKIQNKNNWEIVFSSSRYLKQCSLCTLSESFYVGEHIFPV